METEYHCKKCNRFYSTKYTLKEHFDSEFHKTGKRKIKSKIDAHKCDECIFTTKNIGHLKEHILNNHSDEKTRKESFKFYCEHCRFGTNINRTFNKHTNTSRHKRMAK